MQRLELIVDVIAFPGLLTDREFFVMIGHPLGPAGPVERFPHRVCELGDLLGFSANVLDLVGPELSREAYE